MKVFNTTGLCVPELHYMVDLSARLREIQRMVDIVKKDKEVGLRYMKIYEREELIREMAREEERKNTERERIRADQAEEQNRKLMKELETLRRESAAYGSTERN